MRPPVSGGRRSFSGEDILLILLTKISLGLSFIAMDFFFGGRDQENTPVFSLVYYLYILYFYKKISGHSLEMWIDQR